MYQNRTAYTLNLDVNKKTIVISRYLFLGVFVSVSISVSKCLLFYQVIGMLCQCVVYMYT